MGGKNIGLFFWRFLLALGFALTIAVAEVEISFESARIGEETDSDSSLEEYLSPYRKDVEEYSSEVVGEAAEALKVRTKPENGVANFVADSLRIIGSEIFDTKVDVAFTNFGGLRRDLEKGPLTVGLLTELSPFENFVVLLEVKGDQLKRIVENLARSGGWPQSGMEIRFNNDGRILFATIDGKPIRDESVYKIATIDYLLNTDTHSYPREKLVSVTMSGHRQRDALIEYLKRLRGSGFALKNDGDGRTVLVR